MKSRTLNHSTRPRGPFRTLAQYILVDVLPTLLFLAAMALAMAAFASRLPAQPQVGATAQVSVKSS